MVTMCFKRAILSFQRNYLINSRRLLCLSYKSLPNNLQDQLQLYCVTKLNDYNKLMDMISNNPKDKGLLVKYNEIKPIVDVLSDIELINDDMEDFKKLFKDSIDESDVLEAMKIDSQEGMTMKENLYNKLIRLITSNDNLDDINEVSFEILCGAGGQESMLFASELSSAFLKYMNSENWVVETDLVNASDIGGLRACKFLVSGPDVYSTLKYESGIHRVQRVPTTSTAGKIHTSTVAVVVLPVLRDSNINIAEHQLKWESFRSSGAGGQSVNTTDSAVRVTHIPTGISISCQSSRLQQQNRAEALKSLLNTLHEKQYEEDLQKFNSNRRIVIGTRARSDKIRTYNYPQDRVTDHRIPRSWPNLGHILSEGKFREIAASLKEVDLLERLELVLNGRNTMKGAE